MLAALYHDIQQIWSGALEQVKFGIETAAETLENHHRQHDCREGGVQLHLQGVRMRRMLLIKQVHFELYCILTFFFNFVLQTLRLLYQEPYRLSLFIYLFVIVWFVCTASPRFDTLLCCSREIDKFFCTASLSNISNYHTFKTLRTQWNTTILSFFLLILFRLFLDRNCFSLFLARNERLELDWSYLN